jgi:hypothetical protein
VAKEKTLISTESARAHIEFLKNSGFPFMLKVSNYTTEIVSDLYNIQFLQSFRNKQCFAAYSKIKSNIKGKPTPNVDKSTIKYFQHDFKKDAFYEEVYNIDLKSAYATILHNDNYITPETFKYLNGLKKLDRLASVGMLAGKKHVFTYDDKGKLTDYYKSVSETENFFFHCVKRTDDIMNDLKLIAGNDYLFTWVDGIYFKPSSDVLSEMQGLLIANNFPFTIDILKKFTVKVNKKVTVHFEKQDKVKQFNIPALNNNFANDIIDFLTNKFNNNDVQDQSFKPV